MVRSQRHYKVLVVDDGPALRKVIRASLAARGFAVEEVSTGKALRARAFDLVLLDINMPGPGGVETCQRIRALVPQIGILMVMVRDDEEDKVRALESGADDYVPKPFRLRELVARLGVVLRRTDPQKSAEPGVLQAGSLKMDADRRLLWKGADEVHLSPKEFDLLAYLPDEESRRSADAHPAPARRLGTEYGGELEYLLTEPRVGYRFRNPSDPDAPTPPSDDEWQEA
jgi:two-component system, OmpR family, KDP operon response regulator KdpE